MGDYRWMSLSRLVPPPVPPSCDDVVLRAFIEADVDMVVNLSTDAYVPLTGSLPHNANAEEAVGYIRRQQSRAETGVGYSFCIADSHTGQALATVGLWLADLAEGRATAGYSVAPRARRRGVAGKALRAVTAFGWSIAQLDRIELYIEPWNTASVRTAEIAGYTCHGLLRSHQEIGGQRVDMLLYASIRPQKPTAG